MKPCRVCEQRNDTRANARAGGSRERQREHSISTRLDARSCSSSVKLARALSLAVSVYHDVTYLARSTSKSRVTLSTDPSVEPSEELRGEKESGDGTSKSAGGSITPQQVCTAASRPPTPPPPPPPAPPPCRTGLLTASESGEGEGGTSGGAEGKCFSGPGAAGLFPGLTRAIVACSRSSACSSWIIAVPAPSFHPSRGIDNDTCS